ncbi:MAG TPA: hypothetical protein DCS97_16135 [Planctomycetes bacterium]|nr:hypothetical protein [Planctomycetota bacterium]
MGDSDLRAARERIETVEKRIAALQDAGVDVGALRSQLAFAHGAQREGRIQDVEAICDEVLGAARRLAELGSRSSQPHPAIRTPAQGTRAPQETGTEALRQVRVGRAQLADEVRAAIDAEVKMQMVATPAAAAPAVDLSPLARQLDQLTSRLASLEQQPDPAPATPDLSPVIHQLDQLTHRLVSLEEQPAPAAGPDLSPLTRQLDLLAARLASLEQRPTAEQSDLGERFAALEAQIASLAAAPPAVPIDLSALDDRLAALGAGVERLTILEQRLQVVEQKPPQAMDAEAVAAVVTRVIDETVPRQASELLREAIAKLPTRDDLSQIADTLRADLDWRLEKAAAEHGWCSLGDVQTSVRKALAEQDPSPMGGSQLGRLETALAEFVQQSKDQQDRLITALASRVAQHTKVLTKRMLVRDGAADPVASAEDTRSETEELIPSLSETGQGSSRMAAITGASPRNLAAEKTPTERALDPVPAEALEATRHEHGHTTLFTARVPAADPAASEPPAETASQPTPDLQDLVSAEVERALRGATTSTMTEGAATQPPPQNDTLPMQAPSQQSVSEQLPVERDLSVLIAAEVGRQLANTIPVQLPPSDADLARAVARALPAALQDENVRTELFAVLALEATSKPGVLGELTGLRRFLKRELQNAAAQQQPISVA